MESKPKQDPEMANFNFPKVSLTEMEKSILVESLSFSSLPKQLSYLNYLVNFELFYRRIDNFKILSGYNLDFIKTRTIDSALTSFWSYNGNIPEQLSNEKIEALKTSLSANCNLVIQKADNGKLVVMVQKDVYFRHMESLLDI